MLTDKNSAPKEKAEKMVLKSIYFEPSLWQRARAKAGLTPLSAIIRKMLQLWLDGKIDINQNQ